MGEHGGLDGYCQQLALRDPAQAAQRLEAEIAGYGSSASGVASRTRRSRRQNNNWNHWGASPPAWPTISTIF
jgi:hypothetical protein